MRRFLAAAALLLLCSLAARTRAEAPPAFFLRDGDTVVFYGDSITEQQMYTRDIETYVVAHFPAWHIRFINSGWSGDRVTGGGGGGVETRLRRDVLPYKPTVVTILLGMNDGAYTAYNEAAFQTYSQGLTHIIDELQQQLPEVRLTLLLPSLFDKDAPRAKHDSAYNDTLVQYGKFVKQLGAQRGIPVADLNAPMAAATMKGRAADPKFALSYDGIHPDEAGQLIMASALLQAWNAPPITADIALLPGTPVTVTPALPWPLPDAARAAFAVSPLPGALDTLRLHLSPLFDVAPAGTYTLSVDGKDIATVTGAEAYAGLDLTQYPALPENAQAITVLGLVQDRLNTWHYLDKGGPNAIAHAGDAPSAAETDALLAIDRWLDAMREKACDAAQPQPHTFLLRFTPAAPP